MVGGGGTADRVVTLLAAGLPFFRTIFGATTVTSLAPLLSLPSSSTSTSASASAPPAAPSSS